MPTERERMTGPLDDFTRSYAETALWASADAADVPYSSCSIENLSASAQRGMRADCDSFRARVRSAGFEGLLVDRAGDVAHDFWLTRCRHGSGFWDGDYPEPAGTELTKIAHSFGEAHLYVGDDGLIYQAGTEDR